MTHFGGLARPRDELSLTLDTKLQPALSVTSQVRRKADALFEKEQEFALEEAATSATSSGTKPELYIGENGMLTQTKPDGATPLVYRTWTPSQKTILGSQATAPPTTGPRVPLGELSFTSDPEPDLPASPSQASPLGQRLTRIRKGKERELSSPEALPVAQEANLFAHMMRAAKDKKREEERRKLKKSEYVEGEAMESDEDEMFGFAPKQKEADEESDDDPDEVVENLVDDVAITEEQLARDKVLEKVQ